MLDLATANTDADFDDVYHFWYNVYVGEMGRHLNDANTSHQYRRLYDPLATAGSLCIARRDGQVVGTVLSTPVANPATEKYRALYGLDQLSSDQQSASAITTKLMVAPEQRRTRLPLRLAFATFDWGLRVGVRHNFIDCNDHLVRLFSRLGFQQHLPALVHKDYGRVNSLRLDLTDEAHLRQTDSPFLPLLQRYLREQGLRTHNGNEPEASASAVASAPANPVENSPEVAQLLPLSGPLSGPLPGPLRAAKNLALQTPVDSALRVPQQDALSNSLLKKQKGPIANGR